MNAIRISNGLVLKMKGRWRIRGNATYPAFGNKNTENVKTLVLDIQFCLFEEEKNKIPFYERH